jgi:hypothetical protein
MNYRYGVFIAVGFNRRLNAPQKYGFSQIQSTGHQLQIDLHPGETPISATTTTDLDTSAPALLLTFVSSKKHKS